MQRILLELWVWIVGRLPCLREVSHRLWTDRYRRYSGLEPRILNSDAWDLFAIEAAALKPVVQSTPTQVLLLIIGGWPCKQLCRLSAGQGQVRLRGRDRSGFYIIYLLAAVLQHPHPDIEVQIALENMKMKAEHRDAITQALGIDDRQDGVAALDSAALGPFR